LACVFGVDIESLQPVMTARGKVNAAGTKRRCPLGPLLLVLFALAFIASPANAAVAVDNVTTAQIPSTSPNPFTFSHSTSGSDRLLLVSVASQPNDDDGIIEVVTGITYGGQALTVVGTAAQGPDNSRIEIWRLVNPPTGSNTVSITFNDAFDDPVNEEGASAGAVSFTGVHQGTPLGTFASAISSGSSVPTVAVSSAVGELVFDTVARKGAAVTVDPSQTEQWNLCTDGGCSNVGGGASTEAGAASVTMSWTPANDRWSIGAVSIKPAAVTLPPNAGVCSTGEIFNDGFDSGDFSAWDGSTTGTGDSVGASTDHAVTGTYSLKADVDNVATARARVHKDFTGQTTISATAYIFLDPAFSTSNTVEVLYFTEPGQQILTAQIKDDMTLDLWNEIVGERYTSTATISVGEWHTLEMQAVINGTSSEARLWFDGNLEIEETGIDLGTNPASRFFAGYYWSSPQDEANILFIDDVTLCIPLAITKKAFDMDGVPIASASTIPSGVGFKFLLYINNHGNAVSDVSVRDVLDPAFQYQTTSIQVDNTVAECALTTCTPAEESAIFTAVNGAATLSDAVDGDVASYTGAASAVDAGNENVGNPQLNLNANAVWAMLFTVKML
jgi:hypothetical protein